jgi:1,4-alpha-glucan branching enzyme
MNSDSEIYWGSNVGNTGMVKAEDVRFKQWPFSLRLTLPPLGMLVFKPVEGHAAGDEKAVPGEPF